MTNDGRLLNVFECAFDRICGNHNAELLKSCEIEVHETFSKVEIKIEA